MRSTNSSVRNTPTKKRKAKPTKRKAKPTKPKANPTKKRGGKVRVNGGSTKKKKAKKKTKTKVKVSGKGGLVPSGTITGEGSEYVSSIALPEVFENMTTLAPPKGFEDMNLLAPPKGFGDSSSSESNTNTKSTNGQAATKKLGYKMDFEYLSPEEKVCFSQKKRCQECPSLDQTVKDTYCMPLSPIGPTVIVQPEVYKARWRYEAQIHPDSEIVSQLSFEKGEDLTILDKGLYGNVGWWLVKNSKGEQGIAPKNYLDINKKARGEGAEEQARNLQIPDSGGSSSKEGNGPPARKEIFKKVKTLHKQQQEKQKQKEAEAKSLKERKATEAENRFGFASGSDYGFASGSSSDYGFPLHNSTKPNIKAEIDEFSQRWKHQINGDAAIMWMKEAAKGKKRTKKKKERKKHQPPKKKPFIYKLGRAHSV